MPEPAKFKSSTSSQRQRPADYRSAMRALLEAVTDFLGRYGADHESAKLTNLLARLGWEVPANSNLRWRAQICALRQELDKPSGPDYQRFLSQLVQLHAGAKPPKELSRALFASQLFLHVLVNCFALVFEGHDTELFKLESDVLCHAGGVYEMCLLLDNELFGNDAELSLLGKFLRDFTMVFEDDDPKARWEELFAIHELNLPSFRRDMKRALWRIDDAVNGKTLLEEIFAQEEQGRPTPPRKRVCRAQLEKHFGGSADDWRALSVVNSLRLEKEKEQERATIEDDDDEEEDDQGSGEAAPPPSANGDGASSEETGVWSTRLPFATSGSPPSSPVPENSDGNADVGAAFANAQLAGAAQAPEVAPRADAPAPAVASAATVAAATTAPVPAASASSAQNGDGGDGDGQVSDSSSMEQSIPVRAKRKRWSPQEVEALVKGYDEFGALPNVWVMIKAKYADVLAGRTNVNLKDKHRNLHLYGHLDATDASAAPADTSE